MDESSSALPNPGFTGGDVTLNNISVPGGGNCTISITVSAGSGAPGDLINNTATIVNPVGPNGTPSAPTILFEESQIPVAGGKQLYLDGLNSTTILTRTQPTVADNITLDENPGVDDIVLDLNSVTTRATTIGVGTIEVNLLVSETGPARNRITEVEVLVDADANGSFETNLGSQELNLALRAGESIRKFSLANTSEVPLAAGASFRLIVRNNQNQGGRVVRLHQATSAPFSEIIVPLLAPIEVTDISFYDKSATDDAEGPAGCATTFSCGNLINPGVVTTGDRIWVRATAADVFGSFDVNTACDGTTTTNCPTVTVTNPSSSATTSDLVFVNEPDASSRQYEFEIDPLGFGQEGTWQVEVEFTEGTEGLVFDTSIATFERFAPPVLTVVKSVAGTPTPGLVLTYTNVVTHTDGGDALNVVILNSIGAFASLELVGKGAWSAASTLSSPYTFSVEEFDNDFDDGNGTYDPNTTGVCSLPAAPDPCYDPAIVRWRITLDQDVPVAGSVSQTYRALIQH